MLRDSTSLLDIVRAGQLILQFADSYSEDPNAVIKDCYKDMLEWLKQPDIDNLEDFELSANFPLFQTQPAF